MKTFAIVLLTALSLTACATDDESYRTGAPGLRPGYKPELGDSLDKTTNLPDDAADIEDVLDAGNELDPRKQDELDGILDGKVGEWAEEVLIDDLRLTAIRVDGHVVFVDDDGRIVRDPRK